MHERTQWTEDTPRPEDPLVGRTIAGKYRLESLLGEGGMGGVYRARQVALDKAIAVKVMHSRLASDPLFVARFHKEAKAASRLEHTNSVRVLDFGEEPDGVLYLAMELLDGKDLLTVIDEEGPLSLRRIVDIMSQALSALSSAHEAGIIHRDLKPENIMLLRRKGEDDADQELVKICDFGIAQMADGPDESHGLARARKGKLTIEGLVIGTPDYMSPEQGRGESLDARSDLYSVGVILYLLLSDRTPFEASTALSIVMMHQNEEPLAPSSIRADVDAGLEQVCLKAMRKRAADRYGSAREMRTALGAALNPASTSAGVPRRRRQRIVDAGAVTATMGSAVVTAPGKSTAAAETSPETPKARRRLSRRLAAPAALVALGVGAFLGIWSLTRATPVPFILIETPPLSPSVPPVMTEEQRSTPPLPDPSARVDGRPPPVFPTSRGRRRPDPRAPTLTPPTSSSSAMDEQATLARTSQATGGVTAAAPAIVESPSPAPQPAPPSSPTPFDPSAARVTAGNVQVLMGGIRASELNAVVRASLERIIACYRASASASTPEGAWFLLIATDDEGNVVPGRLDGPLPGAVKDCVSQATRGRVHADTGPVTAKVLLTFSLR